MYFDIGHGKTEGQFGGPDHWFSPDAPDFLFDIDPGLTFPYPR
jgi:hypothetical protein